jgi:hypothetical protein
MKDHKALLELFKERTGTTSRKYDVPDKPSFQYFPARNIYLKGDQ